LRRLILRDKSPPAYQSITMHSRSFFSLPCPYPLLPAIIACEREGLPTAAPADPLKPLSLAPAPEPRGVQGALEEEEEEDEEDAKKLPRKRQMFG